MRENQEIFERQKKKCTKQKTNFEKLLILNEKLSRAFYLVSLRVA